VIGARPNFVATAMGSSEIGAVTGVFVGDCKPGGGIDKLNAQPNQI